MKAFGLLLCLVFAHYGAGSILWPRNYEALELPQQGFFEYFNQKPLQMQNPQRRHYNNKQNVASASDEQQKHQLNQRNRNKHVNSHESSSQETRENMDNENIVSISEYVSPIQAANYWSPFFTNEQENLRSKEIKIYKNMQNSAESNNPLEDQEYIKKIYNDAYSTLKKTNPEIKKQFHEAIQAAALTEVQDAYYNATQLLKQHNYGVEEHTVTTDDGYSLTLFRIQGKQQTDETEKKPVVFLMHGMLGSADDWLLMGPGKSLAYLLSDAGYDVWLGNARGNKYSRQHVSKHPAQKDFWQFSTDEVALHDMPAMIDYVLNTSRQPQMYYVGHSQGTTVFFALAAERPEYNQKIIKMYALAPMVYMTNARSPLFRMIAPNSPFYNRLHHRIGHGEFKPNQELLQIVGGEMCEKETGCRHLCSNVNYVISGVNVKDTDVNMLPVIMKHLPAGASTRQIGQYAQAVTSGEFKKYDYGVEINQQKYGKAQPPSYKIQNVQAPVELYYSSADWLATPKDVERLQKELPNVQATYQVPEEYNFTNMDFQFSNKAQEVYQRLIDSIQKNNSFKM